MSQGRKNGMQLSEALQREVDELVQRTGENPLSIVSRALELLRADIAKQAVNGHGPDAVVHALWEKAGLLGCAKGLPRDLSTNPKHMEGFGRE
jgi:hypothetical protein